MLWNQSVESSEWNTGDEIIGKRSMPKPDITYGFTARDLQNYRGNFAGYHEIRHLSFSDFEKLQLSNPSLHPTVTGGFSRWKKSQRKSITLLSPDYLSFPWAVVEAKHGQVSASFEEFCSCQLANATAVAYDLREKLLGAGHNVPPIIGFSCVGPKVKLWLTYRGTDKKIVSHVALFCHCKPLTALSIWFASGPL